MLFYFMYQLLYQCMICYKILLHFNQINFTDTMKEQHLTWIFPFGFANCTSLFQRICTVSLRCIIAPVHMLLQEWLNEYVHSKVSSFSFLSQISEKEQQSYSKSKTTHATICCLKCVGYNKRVLCLQYMMDAMHVLRFRLFSFMTHALCIRIQVWRIVKSKFMLISILQLHTPRCFTVFNHSDDFQLIP